MQSDDKNCIIISMSSEHDPSNESAREGHELQICTNCTFDTVDIIDSWSSDDADMRSVTLRCGNCEFVRDVDEDRLVIDSLADYLEYATEQIEQDLDLLTKANFCDDIVRFLAAVEADHILPEDF